MSKSLLVIGAGGHARVVADCARESGCWSQIEFYDDAWPELQNSGAWPVSGNIQNLLAKRAEKDLQIIIGIGNNAVRLRFQETFIAAGWNMATVIHPAATISRDATVGSGTVVMAGAVINIGARIGNCCIINTRASVDHDCQLGNAVHLSPGSTLSGTVTVGDCTWLGSGATVGNNLQIGSDSIIGAGATVVSNIADNTLAVGTPAKKKKDIVT